jgi:tRNA threonylcarbamoyladenosine biosynthesis protein TsaB
MLLLSIDTSGKNGSIALAHAVAGGDAHATAAGTAALQSAGVSVIEVVPLAGGTFSAQLVPQIVALLAHHGFSKNDIGAFVVASGPGSFTGLRVGLAAIKALAEILGKPIAAVSLLEVIALSGGAQGKVAAVLDAGRGEVYIGEYEVAGHSAKVLSERLLRKEEAWGRVEGSPVITSDRVLAEAARAAGLTVSVIEPVDAGVLADAGWRKIRSGDTVSPELLEANYIRRSDAEIFAKKSY